MLFFQSCLLIGYLYAYFLSRFTTPVLACIIHATLWLLAFLTLPFSTSQFQTESISKYAALELLINLISHAAFPLTLLGASAPPTTMVVRQFPTKIRQPLLPLHCQQCGNLGRAAFLPSFN